MHVQKSLRAWRGLLTVKYKNYTFYTFKSLKINKLFLKSYTHIFNKQTQFFMTNTTKTTATPKNGTATTNATAQASANGKSTALTVLIQPKEETKEEKKPLTFQERKERTEQLFDLFERHGKLKDHANELFGIVRADESVNTSFKLSSSNGHQWQTTNQEFIKKTVKVMHEAILEKIEEVETEIEFIQIG